jgi:hypothetical protein
VVYGWVSPLYLEPGQWCTGGYLPYTLSQDSGVQMGISPIP